MNTKLFGSLLLFLLLFQNQLNARNKTDSIMILDNGSYWIASKDAVVIVNPSEGGRIISFKLGSYDFLVGQDMIPNAYGSTFWPGPQSMWNWPPPPVLDNEPYSAINNGNSVTVTSGKDPVTGFQFIKEFSAGGKNRIKLGYKIINKTEKVKKVAPWEISRVQKGGLLFFPIGKKPLGLKSFEPADVDIINGIVWYKDKIRKPENKKLSTADGKEGWAAYAIDGKLFIKKFNDVKSEMIAPGEGEVLFYVDSDADFVEFEIEGKYQTLKPEEELNWNVEWIGIKVPSNIKIQKGSKQLVDFVRKIL